MPRVNLPSAPAGGDFSICPHCWYVNAYSSRLCLRCLADMTTLLQESGGLRCSAPVQSPVPVRAGSRLSPLQRLVVLGFVLLLVLAQLATAFAPHVLRRTPIVPVLPGGPGIGNHGTAN